MEGGRDQGRRLSVDFWLKTKELVVYMWGADCPEQRK